MIFIVKLDNVGARFVVQPKALKRLYLLNFSTLFYQLFRHQKGVEKVEEWQDKKQAQL
jgi:hypothetical protein